MTMTGKELAKAFSDFANRSDRSEHNEFVQELLKDHRTLQQSTFRMIYECIKGWDTMYEEGMFDLRNEATCIMAHKIIKATKDDQYIPFI